MAKINVSVNQNAVNAIAERIDGIQRSAGFTSREVAQLLGTTPETISRWRGGNCATACS
jgi:tetrahydromethanopterin S-methyltransferase subunit G